jgi:hypothetical protein
VDLLLASHDLRTPFNVQVLLYQAPVLRALSESEYTDSVRATGCGEHERCFGEDAGA